MKKTPHTPGPWKILRGHNGYLWIVSYPASKSAQGTLHHVCIGLRLVKNNEIKGDAIASVTGLGLKDRENELATICEAEANARLISCAPDLLDAIKAAFEIADKCAYCEEVATILAKAIAKIEGAGV